MASIQRFDPFNELVDDLFKGFLVRPVSYEGRGELLRLKVDVAEKNGAYTVTQDERVLHTERVFGKVSRSFTLPQEVDEAKAEAKFRDGVLELTLPKKAGAGVRRRRPLYVCRMRRR